MDIAERVRLYIENFKLTLRDVVEKGVSEEYSALIEQAKLYSMDAEYYLSEGRDPVTALSCIAYAEGLLDSLKYLGKPEIYWRTPSEVANRPKVLVAGGFEVIHPGHLYFLREAWKKGRVYVIVARDSSIKKFKGRDPLIPEEQRLQVVSQLPYVYRAILGDPSDFLKPVVEVEPDLILLGPDQWPTESSLKEELCKRGLCKVKIERVKERLEGKFYSTSMILKSILKKYCKHINVEPKV
ncbi:MAG: cytidylyltransferase family protein [Sulfolobales archaeon]|nr:cytidylyltransferase family protein [Sulfolobales archaeon]MCX8198702.1 cytidylyltransferase family protein [Sulfolobales archaeon]MDW8169775.1 DUF357 domain-containing protein [Desulfurococcaceae archaeon]